LISAVPAHHDSGRLITDGGRFGQGMERIGASQRLNSEPQPHVNKSRDSPTRCLAQGRMSAHWRCAKTKSSSSERHVPVAVGPERAVRQTRLGPSRPFGSFSESSTRFLPPERVANLVCNQSDRHTIDLALHPWPEGMDHTASGHPLGLLPTCWACKFPASCSGRLAPPSAWSPRPSSTC